MMSLASHVGGGYTATVAFGQRVRCTDGFAYRDWLRMGRLLVWILVLAALIGGAVWLSRMDTTKPLTRVEKAVPANALPR